MVLSAWPNGQFSISLMTELLNLRRSPAIVRPHLPLVQKKPEIYQQVKKNNNSLSSSLVLITLKIDGKFETLEVP
jgi:hypothetical protein